MLSFVRNLCICCSGSSCFPLGLYGITQPKSLRLETLLLVLDGCVLRRLANCTKICSAEETPDKAHCTKVNRCENARCPAPHLSSRGKRSVQRLQRWRAFDVFVAFWKGSVGRGGSGCKSRRSGSWLWFTEYFSVWAKSWNARAPFKRQPC